MQKSLSIKSYIKFSQAHHLELEYINKRSSAPAFFVNQDHITCFKT